ncbi:universal stress protein [Tropicimonas sp. S265A]|uniref:universal stress protein n=1 Tax=Tropicimonas sp. S265A TaxID=3415134 RepID=UPI003C7B6EA9
MSAHYLVAVDLTHMDNARTLLRETGRLAERDGAVLSLMTVLPDYGMSFVGSFFKEGTLKEAEHSALAALHGLAEEVLPDREQVQCIVEVGTAYEEVIEASRKVDADHIVVGAHKPDLAERILGPNAGRIVRYAPVTVTVLRI